MFLHDDCRDVVQRLVKIQSRQSKQKLEDVKLLANENDEGNEIDDAETTKKSKKRRKIGNSGLNEDDLLEYDMNMLLDRDDPRRGTDENLDTMSNMSEFNAAPSGSRGVSEGNNQFYLECYGRDGEPCVKCGEILRRMVIDGRGTTFCKSCQKR